VQPQEGHGAGFTQNEERRQDCETGGPRAPKRVETRQRALDHEGGRPEDDDSTHVAVDEACRPAPRIFHH